MSAHLSDEQFTRYLSGEEDVRAQAHLSECMECRAQASRLMQVVGASRAHVEHVGEQHASFWASQRRQVHLALSSRRANRHMWALASALALLVFASTFMFQRQAPRPETAATASGVAASMSDQELLAAVSSALQQDVPSALAPVQELAYERVRAEQVTKDQ